MTLSAEWRVGMMCDDEGSDRSGKEHRMLVLCELSRMLQQPERSRHRNTKRLGSSYIPTLWGESVVACSTWPVLCTHEYMASGWPEVVVSSPSGTCRALAGFSVWGSTCGTVEVGVRPPGQKPKPSLFCTYGHLGPA